MTERMIWTGPIVDAHQHFWEPAINPHPWLQPEAAIPFRYGDYTAIKRRYLPDDYFADAAGHDVRQTVYVETEWDERDPLGETAYAATIAARFGVPNAIVAQAWLDRSDAEAVIAGQAACPLVRSVRHKPGGPAHPNAVGSQRTLMSNERWRRGYDALQRHGLRFDLQTPWWNLHEASDLARTFPGVTIILNHAGLPSDRSEEALLGWRSAMADFAQAPNVRVKISGLGQAGMPWTVEANRPIVEEIVAMFGAERAMFASNFPVDSLCASFDTIYGGFKQIAARYTREQQRRLFCGTAIETYGLEPAAAAPPLSGRSRSRPELR